MMFVVTNQFYLVSHICVGKLAEVSKKSEFSGKGAVYLHITEIFACFLEIYPHMAVRIFVLMNHQHRFISQLVTVCVVWVR